MHLKCEQRQRTGSFKVRGAYNALASLSGDERARGVVASSAGNHGLGLAWSARQLGVHATIFVPASAPGVKRDGIAALGGEVEIVCKFPKGDVRLVQFDRMLTVAG